ncbi:MAG: error-prone DNA polymerase [Arenicella sp.]|jgi:error-prone DNA polymerase
MRLLRNTHPFKHCINAENIFSPTNNSMVKVSGVVTCRQRPSTASGVIFMTLEDETGNINVVLWQGIQTRFRQAIFGISKVSLSINKLLPAISKNMTAR